MRVLRPAAAGLMRRNENLRALQRREPDVFDDIAIIANQHTGAKSLREIEDGEFGAAAHREVFERMQLAMPLRAAVGHGHDITVVELPRCASPTRSIAVNLARRKSAPPIVPRPSLTGSG